MGDGFPSGAKSALLPLSNLAAGTRLTLSAAGAATSVVVPFGVYEVCLSLVTPGDMAWASWAGAVVLPVSGAAPTANVFALRDGDLLVAPGTTKLATITVSGAGELALNLIK
jgi:hypothetical protein